MPGASGLDDSKPCTRYVLAPGREADRGSHLQGRPSAWGRGLEHVTVRLRRTRWGWRSGARLGSVTHFSHWWLG